MGQIGLYNQLTEFSVEHAGTAEWCRAERDGRVYFVKKFHSPVYPSKEIGLPEKMYQAGVKEFKDALNAKETVYQRLQERNASNLLVVPVQVIHYQFHICTIAEFVTSNVPPDQVCRLSEWQRLVLMRTLTLALMNVHQAGVVHSDMKPDNVLITQDREGHCRLRLIDFDGSFLESAPPTDPEEVVGDPAYFAPESYQLSIDEEIRLDHRIDIFALGIIFPYFWCGKLPDKPEGQTVGECLLRGGRVTLDPSLPLVLRQLISRMIAVEPRNRLSLESVYTVLGVQVGNYAPKLVILNKKGTGSDTGTGKGTGTGASTGKGPGTGSGAGTGSGSGTGAGTGSGSGTGAGTGTGSGTSTGSGSVKAKAEVRVNCQNPLGDTLKVRIIQVPYGEKKTIQADKIPGFRLLGSPSQTIQVNPGDKPPFSVVFTYQADPPSPPPKKHTLWLILAGVVGVFLFFCVALYLFSMDAYGEENFSSAKKWMDLTPLFSTIFSDTYENTVMNLNASRASVGTNTLSMGYDACQRVIFTAPSAGKYRFYTTGKEDTWGRLYTSATSDRSVVSNDNNGGNKNFQIEYTLRDKQTVYLDVYCQNSYATVFLDVHLISSSGNAASASAPQITATPAKTAAPHTTAVSARTPSPSRTFEFLSAESIRVRAQVNWTDTDGLSPYTVTFQYDGPANVQHPTYWAGGNKEKSTTFSKSFTFEDLVPGKDYILSVADRDGKTIEGTYAAPSSVAFESGDLKAASVRVTLSPRQKNDGADDSTAAAVTALRASEINSNRGKKEYGFQYTMEYPSLATSRTYFTQIVITAPNGYLECEVGEDAAYSGNHKTFYMLGAWTFKKNYEYNFVVPQGTWQVDLYWDGMLVNHSTFQVL